MHNAPDRLPRILKLTEDSHLPLFPSSTYTTAQLFGTHQTIPCTKPCQFIHKHSLIMALLDIPAEVRLNIYKYFLPTADNVCLGKHLRKTCRFIQQEFGSEVARHIGMDFKNVSVLIPHALTWKMNDNDIIVQLGGPISALVEHEKRISTSAASHVSDHFLVYKVLEELPKYVKLIGITLARDGENEESRFYLSVSAAITIFMIA